MAFQILISNEANRDILIHTEFYFKKGGESLALRFYKAFKDSTKTLRNFPYFQVSHQNIRKIPIRNFPFLIFYTIKDEVIVILRVFHTSQNPEKYPG